MPPPRKGEPGPNKRQEGVPSLNSKKKQHPLPTANFLYRGKQQHALDVEREKRHDSWEGRRPRASSVKRRGFYNIKRYGKRYKKEQ